MADHKPPSMVALLRIKVWVLSSNETLPVIFGPVMFAAFSEVIPTPPTEMV